MADPKHFDVVEAINIHMQDASGALKRVDRELARKQWNDLRWTFESNGANVDVLLPAPEVLNGVKLPDFCFAANQAFPILDGTKRVVMARMKSALRQKEISFYEDWFRNDGWEIIAVPNTIFEGCGDAIADWKNGVLWAGYGHRTELGAYEFVQSQIDIEIIPVKILSPEFYHLDTCLSVLNSETVAYVEGAFDPDVLVQLNRVYKNVIPISAKEGLRFFAGNCFSADGKNVILQSGANLFCHELKKIGLNPVEVDTSEFLKSGGSVFCMKNKLS